MNRRERIFTKDETLLNHPILEVFKLPHIRYLLEEHNVNGLRFKDFQYLLCHTHKNEPIKRDDSWDVFERLNLKELQIYKSKSHLAKDLKRLQNTKPPLLRREKKLYCLTEYANNHQFHRSLAVLKKYKKEQQRVIKIFSTNPETEEPQYLECCQLFGWANKEGEYWKYIKLDDAVENVKNALSDLQKERHKELIALAKKKCEKLESDNEEFNTKCTKLVLQTLWQFWFLWWGAYPNMKFNVIMQKLRWINKYEKYQLKPSQLMEVAKTVENLLTGFSKKHPPLAVVIFGGPF